MAIKVKWDVDGKGEEAWGGGGDRYEGKVPPKGSYIAKLKRITLGKIAKEGENKGKPRLSVLYEIVGGAGTDNKPGDGDYEYYGAPIWDGVNIIKAQAGRANMFAHALTDGSDAAKREVENKFWPPNMDIRAERVKRNDGSEDIHIKSIGKYKVNSPNGEILVRIVTKMGKGLDGSPRAEISQVLPYTGPTASTPSKPSEDGDDEGDDLLDGDDGDEEFDAESDDDFGDDNFDDEGDGEGPPF